MSAQRILITGGAGFIGTHLCERLVQNAEVILADNFRRDSLSRVPELASHPRVKVISADVLDARSVREAFRAGIDIVLHLAAIAGVSSYYQEPLQTLQVNILGMVNVLEEAARQGVKHFVYFSTSEVFGRDALWVKETDVPQTGPVTDLRWTYATSKLAGEHFTLRYGEKYGFKATVVRPFNIYGPRQTGEGAISNFCKAAVSGQPLMIYGDGSAIRAWCYVDDLVDAVEAILQSPAADGQVFNIGNPREVETTLGLARRVMKLRPGLSIQYRDTERTEVRARIPSIDKARELLGFEPKIDLNEGLHRTLTWYQKGQA